MNQIKNYTLPVLVLLSGIFLSTISAYYSILGLISIFSGSALLITLMGVGLETAKITACLWLHKHWNDKIGFLKVYLSFAVVVLMLITSLGVYGFLTKANLKQSESVNLNLAKVTALESNIVREQSRLDLNSTQIAQYNDLMSKLTTKDVRRASNERRRIQSEIKVLAKESKEIAKSIDNLNTELLPYKSEINAVEVEVGTLLYISKLIYGDDYKEYLPQTLTVLTLLIIFVFDPLAIGLLIASQKSFRMIPFEDKRAKRNGRLPLVDGIKLDVSPKYREAIEKRKEELKEDLYLESPFEHKEWDEAEKDELRDVLNNISKEPEPLGDEFEKVLHDNLSDLYEGDAVIKDEEEQVQDVRRLPKRRRQMGRKI